MNKSIFTILLGSDTGRVLVSLAMIHMIKRRTSNVAYFKPVVEDFGEEKDRRIETILKYFDLKQSYEESFVFNKTQILDYRNKGKMNEVYDAIIDRYSKMEAKYDFIFIDGCEVNSSSDYDANFEYNLDSTIAKTLNSPVVLVYKDSHKKSLTDLVNDVEFEINNLTKKGNKLISTIITKFRKDPLELNKEIENRDIDKSILICPIQRKEYFDYPTLKEIAVAVNAKVILDGDLDKPIGKFIIGAMQLSNFINYVEDGCVALIPGDRMDLFTGVLLASLSNTFPRISGLIISADSKIDANMNKFIQGINLGFPILSVDNDTFETAKELSKVKASIYAENTSKIKSFIDLFEKNVDTNKLEKKISLAKVEGITPYMFQYNLINKARESIKTIVLPESGDERVLKAASMVAQDKVAKIVLIGNEAEIKSNVGRLGLYWDKDFIKIIPVENPSFKDYYNTLFELRKDKGLDLVQAKDLMLDPTYYGTMMVYKGDADGMVSGAQNTTAHTIRPALQFVKTKPGVKTVSSVFFMLLESKVVVYGDCAVVPNPTAEQLADIAISSADTALSFGIYPRVAMLSYSSGDSGSGVDVEKVREATTLVKERRPDLLVEGPIQYDAAVEPSIGNSKMPGSKVAGQANVLIFPDLNTGNNTYKAVQRESGGLALGPVLQGLKKPVNDLSRGAKVEDIYNTIIITAIQS